MAAAGADAVAVRLGVVVGLAVGLAAAVLWATGERRGVDYLISGGQGPSASVIYEDFGPGSAPPGRTGYDGQQFYAIARYFPDLDAAAGQLDAPRYRLLRVLVPAVASVAPPGEATVALLVGLNVAGLALFCAATAAIAGRHGLPAAAGLAAGLPLLPALVVCTVEPAAFGLGMLGVAFADRHRHGAAAAALVAGALTREAVAVMALGTALGLFLARTRRSGGTSQLRWLVLYCLPALAVVGWYLLLGQLVGGDLPDRVDFLSLVHMAGTTVALVVSVTALCALGAWLWRRAPAVWPVGAVFALWTPFYFAGTFDWLALIRVNAPGLGLAVARIFGAPRLSPRGGRADPPGR
ncbi:MAG: hypothetical protein KY454_11325 [Actinobacteria bacterium]|nr:hypothetical protein [Actinomycetota bacterium]MBW3651677.1 hypothetical protein [Actinomycetota bacterium]